MRKSWVRRMAVLGTASLVAGVCAVALGSRPASAANDPGCTTLGGDDTTVLGTCQVTGVHNLAASVTVLAHQVRVGAL